MATSANSIFLEPPNEASLSYAGWRVVLAAHFGSMVGFGSLLVFTFSIFLKPLSAEFGWSREAVSQAFGFAALTVAVVSPLLGKWLDRYGPRRVVLPCMAVFALAFGSLGLLTPHLAHFYAVFVLLGIVGNGTTQMGYSRAVSTWFDRRRGVAFALVMAGTGVGSIVLPILAQSVISAYGWRTAYLILGLLAMLLGIPLTARYVRERDQSSTEGLNRDRMSQDGFTVKKALQSRAFWIVAATLFLSSVAVNGAITHLSALLTDRGISAGEAALASSTLGATSLLGRLITGSLLDRFFGPHVAFALAVSMACGILLLSSAATYWTALVAAMLIGLGLGGEADITPYLLTRYFGLRSFSTLYGFTWTAYAIAGAIGPVILGHAFDASGSYTKFLIILAFSTFVAAALLLGLPQYSRHQMRTGVPE
jgi:MFS family permease